MMPKVSNNNTLESIMIDSKAGGVWSKRQPKYFWHVHHDSVLAETTDEYLGGIRERIDYINQHKPQHERTKRLALLTPVKHTARLAALLRRSANTTIWTDDRRRRGIYDDIVALHKIEHPRCPARIHPFDGTPMPYCSIFQRGKGGTRLVKRLPWMTPK